jgi:hypothetical protein
MKASEFVKMAESLGLSWKKDSDPGDHFSSRPATKGITVTGANGKEWRYVSLPEIGNCDAGQVEEWLHKVSEADAIMQDYVSLPSKCEPK